jgi:hypothetical protein
MGYRDGGRGVAGRGVRGPREDSKKPLVEEVGVLTIVALLGLPPCLGIWVNEGWVSIVVGWESF